MKTRTLFSSALLLSGLALLALNSRSSSQEPTLLIESQPLPLGDGERVPFGEPLPLNPVGGALIHGPVDVRAVTPAVQFDTARPKVIEYMQLHGQLAERLSDEELDLEIAGLRATLQIMDADDGLNEIRQSLRLLIESHPDTPAADAARRALEQLEGRDQANWSNQEFDPGSGDLKPVGGNRPLRSSSSFDIGSIDDDN